MARISIIIPVLNESVALRRHLPLLQPLRKAGHELLLVDGGSEDGSIASCRQLVDQIRITPAGRARQMNAGARCATGDILLFLHIDTVLPEGAVRMMLQALAGSRRGWGRFNVYLDGREKAFRVIECMMNLRSRLTGIATGDQAIFVRRELFFKAGAYPDIPLMEDIEFSKRLKRYSRPLCLRQRVISSARRWHKHGIASTVLLMWRLRLAYFLGARPDDLYGRYYGLSSPDTAQVMQRLEQRSQDPDFSYPQARILLFARAPVAGKVKTRLQPALSDSEALELHQRLIHFTWQRLWQRALAPVSIWISEPGHEEFFDGLCVRTSQFIQQGADLGDRMFLAASETLREADKVVIVGADCASVDSDYVERALQALTADNPVVIGPAEDGGYVLLGLHAPVRQQYRRLFRDVSWGSGEVLNQTRDRLREVDLRWQELPARWDVDTQEDLLRLAALPAWQKWQRSEAP